MIETLRQLNKTGNRHAGKLLLLGLAAVALHNWRLWQQDRVRLAKRPQPPNLPPLEEWPSQPKVSVLVAAWNEGHIIEDHIESFRQVDYPSKELILCAGGDDDTYERAQASTSEQIIVLRQRPGEGKQRALSRCLERATGEIIFLTDADCLLDTRAFLSTIAPLILEGESAVTGTSEPLASQQYHPFVAYQWAIQAYGWLMSEPHSSGLLGRNCAMTRSALTRCGDLSANVSTGTDYHLARQILGAGYRIRLSPESAVRSEYATDVGAYTRQQSRWLRNLFLHGVTTGDHFHVHHFMVTGLTGIAGLALPLLALLSAKPAVLTWLWLMVHSIAGRLRYIAAAEARGITIPWQTRALLPAFVMIDWQVWTTAVVDSMIAARQRRW